MPDWSYQTLLKPAFRALPPHGRERLLRVLDTFGRSPLAGPLVSFIGHMDAGADSALPFAGRALPSPVGLSCRLPGHGDLAALTSRFGVGFVELGPLRSMADARVALARLRRPRAHSAPVAFRLEGASEELVQVLDTVAPVAAFVSVGGADTGLLRMLANRAKIPGVPLLAVLPAGTAVDTARAAGASGVWLEALDGVPQARLAWPDALIVAASGVMEPGDAVAALDAGADAVAIDEGLLASGPGFPKRVNEVLRHRRQSTGQPPVSGRWLPPPWLGMFAMAMVLLASGLAAWAVGLTHVVLAYDEEFLGLDRDGIDALNPRLIDFLAHDRVSFAATTVSSAILLAAVSYHGARRHEAWARRLLAVSALAGFTGFFLFLGFGYLDPLHSVVWVGAMVGFLWGLRGRDTRHPWVPTPDLHDDDAWRRSQWGQLLLVGLGLGLTIAGLAVCIVGVTSIFVPTDLDFMQTSSKDLDASNPRLLSLVAHDRAGFGEALTSNGLAVLLLALWGVRRGARWVWWTLVAAGVTGFAGVVAIHAAVGYLHLSHMAPAYLALAVFVVAAGLCHKFMAAQPLPSTPD